MPYCKAAVFTHNDINVFRGICQIKRMSQVEEFCGEIPLSAVQFLFPAPNECKSRKLLICGFSFSQIPARILFYLKFSLTSAR
jgi:hypothetical protein